MRTDSELSRYQKTLVQYRADAKVTIASTEPGSDERGDAIRLLYRCDGAIAVLDWVLEKAVDVDISPTLIQREVV
jgi:hypothetical protein